MKDFANEPVLELRRAPVRESLTAALAELEARLPLPVPVLVGGERVAREKFASTDPADPERVVALAGRGTEADASDAVATAARGFREWSARSATQRAEVLTRAAGALRERRIELAAVSYTHLTLPTTPYV